ncbi:hypothetical protein [Pseudomonas anguilliseptica]|uniref:hypothetical protein n=1 Tax=Pseudomonas anguilliseptica TaxID=53406 RepID=UPI0022AEF847|nr:hypothetical protein [Pseudomonas anguilliseptica]MCZ4323984.1 hypothetical protein [Pseudomonas anguilliseptica]
MTITVDTAHDGALAHTINLLNELRHALDLIRAETEREELASAVQDTKGHLAALREELEDTIAYHGGQKLAQLAEELEREYGFVDDEEVFSIGELREMAKTSPRALDSSYRSIHEAWETYVLPYQLEQHLDSTGSKTSFEWQVKHTLLAYFDEAKAR